MIAVTIRRLRSPFESLRVTSGRLKDDIRELRVTSGRLRVTSEAAYGDNRGRHTVTSAS